jgi:hypothetical protein
MLVQQGERFIAATCLKLRVGGVLERCEIERRHARKVVSRAPLPPLCAHRCKSAYKLPGPTWVDLFALD